MERHELPTLPLHLPRDNGDVRCGDCACFDEQAGGGRFGSCELGRKQGFACRAPAASVDADASRCPGFLSTQAYLDAVEEARREARHWPVNALALTETETGRKVA